MKRLAQLAAILVIGLLAVQPAFSGQPCSFGATQPCVPGCPEAMNGMGPDCAMARGMAASACPLSCCVRSPLTALVAFESSQRLEIPVAAVPFALPLLGPVPGRVPSLYPPLVVRASSPPPYLLNRVFRI